MVMASRKAFVLLLLPHSEPGFPSLSPPSFSFCPPWCQGASEAQMAVPCLRAAETQADCGGARAVTSQSSPLLTLPRTLPAMPALCTPLPLTINLPLLDFPAGELSLCQAVPLEKPFRQDACLTFCPLAGQDLSQQP